MIQIYQQINNIISQVASLEADANDGSIDDATFRSTAVTSLAAIETDLNTVKSDLENADNSTIAALNDLAASNANLVAAIVGERPDNTGSWVPTVNTALATAVDEFKDQSVVNTSNVTTAIDSNTTAIDSNTTAVDEFKDQSVVNTSNVTTAIDSNTTAIDEFKIQTEIDTNSLAASISGTNPIGAWVPPVSLAEVENDKIRQTEYYNELWNVINWIELKKRQEDGEDVDPLEKTYDNVDDQFTDLDPSATGIDTYRTNPVHRTRFQP